MDERVLRFRVGVVVVAAAIITIILITLLGAWPSPFKPRYTVNVKFPTAPGVTIDTPVRKSGIQIGRVADLQLQNDGNVLLTLKIDAKYKLREDQVCRISTGSMVTGDAVLEWVKSDAGGNLPVEYIADGDYLENGMVAEDPFTMLAKYEEDIKATLTTIQRAGQSIEGAGQEVQQVAHNLNRIFDSKDQQLEDIVDQALLAMQNFNGVMDDVKAISGNAELRDRLQKTVARLPDLFANAEKTLTQAQGTLHDFSGVAVRAERNLANLEDFTAPLGARGEEISQNLVDSVRSVNELLDNLAQLSQALRNEDGTIGQLIHNPELYERVNRTAAEIEKLVRKLEPILDDFRVISYKIATDPSQMGVKGLLDRRPSGAGQKYPTGAPPSAPGTRLRFR